MSNDCNGGRCTPVEPLFRRAADLSVELLLLQRAEVGIEKTWKFASEGAFAEICYAALTCAEPP